MESEWKCSFCEHWNINSYALCVNCRKKKIEHNDSEEESKARRLEISAVGGISIYQSDSIFLKIIKRVLIFFRFIFFAILSIFLWLVAVSHG